VATNQLRTALIHEVKLLQDRSTFPVPLGVAINCIPSNEMTDLGERYAYTVLPTVTNTVGQVIYQGDVRTEEGMQVRPFFSPCFRPARAADRAERSGARTTPSGPRPISRPRASSTSRTTRGCLCTRTTPSSHCSGTTRG
jgi:hypothetical protein